jgi:hypothetical protein
MNSKSYWFAISAATWLAIAPAAWADDKKEQAIQANEDGPGQVHKQLDVLAGTWNVAIKFKLGVEEHEGKARCQAHWILDGRFLQQDYTSRFQGRPFSVLQLLGYDNQKKKTIEIVLESRATGVKHSEGSISEDGKVITNQGEVRDPVSGNIYQLKTVTTIKDNDHFTLEWCRLGDDGKEEKVVTLNHTRTKS